MTMSTRGFPPSLDENTLLGQYGEDYVRALASACGVQHGIVSPRDLLKVDVSLTLPGRVGNLWNPGVWAQVKTTAGIRTVGSRLHYDVDVETYNVLCRRNQVPRVLIVVTVPGSGPLVEVSADSIAMLGAAFWASWTGQPESVNKTSVTVDLPADHLLTTEEMHRMILSAGSSTSSRVVLPDRFES